MPVFDETLAVLDRCLALGGRARDFDASTRLLGSLPELDSMAVVGVITGLEEHFGIAVHDDEISADTFETVGSLVRFVEHKLAASSH
jgi:acyl carrier protein